MKVYLTADTVNGVLQYNHHIEEEYSKEVDPLDFLEGLDTLPNSELIMCAIDTNSDEYKTISEEYGVRVLQTMEI